MRVFISHNSGDKETARLLAMEFVECGVDVWFDEWKIRPGESITGGMELGISQCDAFVLFWSQHAADSRWVETEVRAALRRRVDDANLRVIPLMLDDTPLPALVADYRGFALRTMSDLKRIAAEIVGDETPIDMTQRLQKRLLELVVNEFPVEDAIRALFCPACGSTSLTARLVHEPRFNARFYSVLCLDCRCEQRAKADTVMTFKRPKRTTKKTNSKSRTV